MDGGMDACIHVLVVVVVCVCVCARARARVCMYGVTTFMVGP
jgi:hypothetical protein